MVLVHINLHILDIYHELIECYARMLVGYEKPIWKQLMRA